LQKWPSISIGGILVGFELLLVRVDIGRVVGVVRLFLLLLLLFLLLLLLLVVKERHLWGTDDAMVTVKRSGLVVANLREKKVTVFQQTM
jgi:hypothetical protein